MGGFENPSGGRFDAPSQASRFEPPSPARTRGWLLGLAYVGTGSLAFLFAHRFVRLRWGAAAGALIGLAMMVAHSVLGYRIRDERGGTDPYTKHENITR